ncbi:MAG: nucleotide exchange factor GrpE [Salibacteraceae bacterium]
MDTRVEQENNEMKQSQNDSENLAKNTEGAADKPRHDNKPDSQHAQAEPQSEVVAGDEAPSVGEDAAGADLESQLAEERNKYLRLYAEFENFRKRNARERVELLETAGQHIVKELLPVLDDFERAIQSNEAIEDTEALKDGFKLLFQKLHSTLRSKGLKEFDVQGEPFDAEIHEAIAQAPAAKPEDKGKVLEVVEKGYKLNDRIIRHPKVVVGS